jgi:hypothetical protein
MLGLISHINDILQDIQGKKSMASKRQILRSLESLVTHVGSAINNVAPQVCLDYRCFPLASNMSQLDHGNSSNNG